MAYKVPSVEDVSKAAMESGFADASVRNREKALAFLSEYRDQVCEWTIAKAAASLSEGMAPVATVTAADVAQGYLAAHMTFDEMEDAAVADGFPMPVNDADADRFKAACSSCILHDVARAFSDEGYHAYVTFDRIDVYLPARAEEGIHGHGTAPGSPKERSSMESGRPVFQHRQ